MPGADMPQCCQDTMRKVCADFGAEPRELNNQDDHAHLLADDPPNVAICAPVNNLNGVPARRPRTEFTGQANPHIMHGHFWSPSYLTASRRGAPPGTSGNTPNSKGVRSTRLPGLPRLEGRSLHPAIKVSAGQTFVPGVTRGGGIRNRRICSARKTA